jgi:hypothetical protein
MHYRQVKWAEYQPYTQSSSPDEPSKQLLRLLNL